MTTFQPDPEWFKGPYAHLWKQHAEKVKALVDELVSRFPSIKDSIRVGLGADSDRLVKVPPHQRDEPDLEIFHEYNLLCHIEVSGSDRVSVPPSDIWIRPGKIDLATEKEGQGQPCWFYMVYRNNAVWVIRPSDTQPYRDRIKHVAPYGKRETYVEIPYAAAHPKDYMFDWIEERIE